MAAYVIAENLAMRDPDGMAEYRAGVAATVERYGGKFLVRGGAIQALEGGAPNGLVVIQFENADQARAWYNSQEYQPLVTIRQRCADTRLTLVEGV
jgi:uncharacterized protein (DUF1330 family)